MKPRANEAQAGFHQRPPRPAHPLWPELNQRDENKSTIPPFMYQPSLQRLSHVLAYLILPITVPRLPLTLHRGSEAQRR